MCYVWGEEFRRQDDEDEDEEERNVSGPSHNNNVRLCWCPVERTLDVIELLRMRNSSVLMSSDVSLMPLADPDALPGYGGGMIGRRRRNPRIPRGVFVLVTG
jgi:hypothetical protein